MDVLIRVALLVSIAWLSACATRPSLPSFTTAVTGGDEAVSLLGRRLAPMPLAPDVRADRQAKLDAAVTVFESDPRDEDAIIWVGRRLAYLGRYREAIEVYTNGLVHHPESYRLLRHRGHRHITLRNFAAALDDLDRAASLIVGVPDAVEADGLPNARNIPTSTSHTNIYYHLGLARYLTGDFNGAAEAYRQCLGFARNADMECATRYWLYLAHQRHGRDQSARAVLEPVHVDMPIIENVAYHQLLLLYKGEITPASLTGSDDAPVGAAIENATAAYGLAMHARLDGNHTQADQMLETIVTGAAWPAFGHIAAEVDLAARRR